MCYQTNLKNGLGDTMDYIIALSQLILFAVFVFTLKCELSKNYSDSVVFVSIRTFIMCSSAITFFMLFEHKYQNVAFLALVFIPVISGLLYTTLEKISPTIFKYQKGI